MTYWSYNFYTILYSVKNVFIYIISCIFIASIFASVLCESQHNWMCNLWCGSCFNGLLYAGNLSSSAGPQWMQRAHLCWNEGLSELPAECKCGVLCIGWSQSRSRLPDLCREKNESGSLFIVSTQSGAYKDQHQNSDSSLTLCIRTRRPLPCEVMNLKHKG